MTSAQRPAQNATPYPDDLYCPECGYSLRGLTSARCPECGLSLEFIRSDAPLIPWERRRQLGRLRAYWQTVFQVLFRTKRFCRASCRPVSHPDAQRFRWVTILHVYLPALAVLPVAHWANPNMLRDAVEETSGWFVTLVGAWVLPTLLVLTGLPSYLFHPRRLTTAQQNRAVALSYYGTAPLGLLAPLAAAAVGTLAFADHLRGEPGAVVGLSVSFATLVSCVALGTRDVVLGDPRRHRPARAAQRLGHGARGAAGAAVMGSRRVAGPGGFPALRLFPGDRFLQSAWQRAG